MVGVTATVLPVGALAQDRSPTAPRAPAHANAHDDNDPASGAIVVTGHLPLDLGLLASAKSLEGDALVTQTRGQLGETLARLPGVSATSFAPGTSRPVLRGFDGDRIRVLVDGIGSIDASNVSADHAVVFDPLTVDHIDVIHGPAALLFGGSAIGGAVNALDKRIPRRVPREPSVVAIGGYGSAADERHAGAALAMPVGDRFALSADASWRKSDDLRVPGFVVSQQLRADLLADASLEREEGHDDEADELEAAAAIQGRLPNSGARSLTLGAGAAFIDSGGNLGVSVQRYETRYGVPTRPGAGHHHEDEHDDHDEDGDHEENADESEAPVSIDLVQTRLDVRGGVEIGGLIDSLEFRGAYGDYRHVEFEGDEIGTTFAGRGLEGRVDMIQSERNGWRGRSGVQLLHRKLNIRGAEAFTPDNVVDRFSVFTLQSVKLGTFEIEGAGRFERATVRARPIAFERGFDLWSGAAGVSFVPAQGWKLGASYIRGARAPSPEELLSNGLHVASQSFEIGNPGFARETSDGLEAYLRYKSGRTELSLTGFQTDFDGFIAALPTGTEQDGFPVFQYAQFPARFRGFEAEASFEIARIGPAAITAEAAADYVHATLAGVGPVPRIPPLRLRGGLTADTGALRLHGEVEWNARQDRVAAFESPVASFTHVNIGADWHPWGEDGPLTVIAEVNNLFDAEGRRAASISRDYVPLPGRDARITLKLAF